VGVIPDQRGRKDRALTKDRARTKALLTGALALVLATAACGSLGSGGGTSTGAKQTGGTASYALPPGTVPNYIFPFASSTYFSVVNSEYFQHLMYRPLYWFGDGASPTLNTGLSLANAPQYNGNKITITMKGWKWSNGESVTANDVVFWIHMMQAVGRQDWGAYVPGGFPANVSDVTVVSPAELTMTMNKNYNTTWFTYNELSQITPMPKAWDRSATGPSDCASNEADCADVYSYLDGQSRSTSTWTGSTIWSVVDGPWKLQSFSADGHSIFSPNPRYSGPVKPSLSGFREVPFTTEAAEYNVLRAGDGELSVGYLPTTYSPDKPQGQDMSANPVSGYRLHELTEVVNNLQGVTPQSTTANLNPENWYFTR
jgi:peptide/nickel transport system substrate-binding protein